LEVGVGEVAATGVGSGVGDGVGTGVEVGIGLVRFVTFLVRVQ
jgi:hypothetical protein